MKVYGTARYWASQIVCPICVPQRATASWGAFRLCVVDLTQILDRQDISALPHLSGIYWIDTQLFLCAKTVQTTELVWIGTFSCLINWAE